MYFRDISGDGVNYGRPYGTDHSLASSRILYRQEVLVAYNVKGTSIKHASNLATDEREEKSNHQHFLGLRFLSHRVPFFFQHHAAAVVAEFDAGHEGSHQQHAAAAGTA
jgi:hypothetical protein